MPERGWVVGAIAFALVFAAGCSPPVDPDLPRGVILVSLDTLRADHLGAYGYSRETSPNLDRVAAGGVVFERAIAPSNSTLASHKSLFRSRVVLAEARSAEPPLAELLQQRGFRTAAFTGGGYVAGSLGFERGFEVYDEDRLGLSASIPKALGWVEAHSAEPFFLFLHTYDAHLPYDPPPPYDRLFSPSYTGTIEGAATRDLLRRIRKMGRYRDVETQLTLSAADRERVVALYDGGIRYVDDLMAGFFGRLKELGLWDSIILVVLSDHGEEFWDHGSVIHSHTLYQELIHVPLIWRLPDGRHAGRRVSEVVSLVDVAPTLLDLVGAPSPASFRGASLLPVLEGRGRASRPVLSRSGRHSAVIDAPWKLILGRGGETQLFHLDNDPAERRDQSAAQPERVSALRSQVEPPPDAPIPATPEELEKEPVELVDEELRARLRELGYID